MRGKTRPHTNTKLEYLSQRRRIEGVPNHDEEIEKNSKISEEEAREMMFSSNYALEDIGVDHTDPLGYQAGEEVYIEPTDAVPGQHPQHGKLRGLNSNKVVIELDNGLRVHFPRIGYVIHRAVDAEGKSVLETLKAAAGAILLEPVQRVMS